MQEPNIFPFIILLFAVWLGIYGYNKSNLSFILPSIFAFWLGVQNSKNVQISQVTTDAINAWISRIPLDRLAIFLPGFLFIAIAFIVLVKMMRGY